MKVEELYRFILLRDGLVLRLSLRVEYSVLLRGRLMFKRMTKGWDVCLSLYALYVPTFEQLYILSVQINWISKKWFENLFTVRFLTYI